MIEIIEVPVLLRDRDGRLVKHLSQDDFQVLEDGVPQTLVFFERVDIPIASIPQRSTAATPVVRDVGTNDVPADSRCSCSCSTACTSRRCGRWP